MDSETCAKEPQKMDFQAEVRRVLDIVINSLYTERDIFVRELISNASDALEKFRLVSLMENDFRDKDLPLEINIETDEKENTLVIADTGIGMTREELIENLGTIAHSGSREFLKRLAEGDSRDAQLIGQFGVGFYSAFMVASSVRVMTLSYRPGSEGWEWESDGAGSYTVSPARGLKRGTRIIISLKEDAREYAEAGRIKKIIRQYSNFVPFDIRVNGEKVNTVQAIWARNKSEIKEEEYSEFFKFLTNSFMDPMYRLHLSSDAPIQLNALFFIPAENPERFGFGRLDPGVNLYSRKVLIQQNARDILPEYLRFVKGVVDSEDLPLNISRETTQNSRLIKKMSRFLTRRLISFLEDEASRDQEKYRLFWDKFSMFIKEGCVNDPDSREQLAKLLRFQSSRTGEGEMIPLADYVGRMKDNQTAIYYLNGPSREIIEAGPYLEAFRERDIEVLYLLDPVDDFVMTALQEFQGKKLVSADQADLDLPPAEAAGGSREVLSPEEIRSLTAWMKEVLGDTVSDVRESRRLVDSPAMVVNPDRMFTTTMQRVLRAADKDFGGVGPKVLEINPGSGVIVRLARLREKGADGDFLRSCVEQIADNAFLAAGLPGARGNMIDRIYKIMERALESQAQ
ncbi:MAG: molecular chaperone HtpG [Peptococcaceae bacterium]|nr:molecular chaperone HtpG [Peptococcaceae bacterium]